MHADMGLFDPGLAYPLSQTITQVKDKPGPPAPVPTDTHVYLRGTFSCDLQFEAGMSFPAFIRLPADLDWLKGRIGSYLTFDNFKPWAPERYPAKLSESRLYKFARETGPGTPAHEVYYQETKL